MTLQQDYKANEQWLEGFDEFIASVMADAKIPGLAIAIVKEGEVILAQGYGKRNAKEELAVTPQTMFAIGSSSKAFTAMTLAILVSDGKLDWDTPVKHYLPTFKLQDSFATEHLTPRDLLIHNSGLPRHDLAWYNSTASRKDLFERLQHFEPNKGFRTTWQYQNLMYMTAGYLVEAVTGQTWEEFTKERIFEPLGMTASNFSVHESQEAPDFALPYQEIKDEVQEINFYDRFQAIGPAGSINSHVLDMSKWLACLLNKGKYGDGEQRLLSEEQFTQLVTPHIIAPDLPTLFTKYKELFHWTYSPGWFISSYRGHTMVQHGGNIDGFSALVAFLPDDQTGIVVLTNLDGNFITEVIAYNICDRLLGLEPASWHERFKEKLAELKAMQEKGKQANIAERVADAPLTHSIEAYSGQFEHPGYGTLTISQDGANLKGIYNDMDLTFTHQHYDVFLVEEKRFDIQIKGSFSTNLKGEIDSFSLGMALEPGTKPIVFTRIPTL